MPPSRQNNTSQKSHQQNQLNLANKLRQKSIVQHINVVNWDKTSDAPIVVELDPTTACNLACPDCISRDLLNQGYFSRERLRSLIKELVEAGVKAVIFIGGGEPLAHPEIGWAIEYLGKHGVQIGITTNGLLIKRYLEPISKYANWVRVSMDAGTSETFQRIRPSPSGKSEFDKAIDNMRALAKVKKGKLGYSFMIYQEGKFDAPVTGKDKKIPLSNYTNAHEIATAADIAKAIGCDYFEIKPMYDINHFAIMQRQELITIVKQQLDRVSAHNSENFKVLYATKLLQTLSDGEAIEEKDYTRCAVAQLRTLITPSGAYVCPYFRGKDHKRIGDLSENSLKEVWHGDQRKSVMADLNPSIDCKMHCIRHDSNMMIEDLVQHNQPVETINDYDFFI